MQRIQQACPTKNEIFAGKQFTFYDKTFTKNDNEQIKVQKYIYKNRTTENWEKYRILRNACVKETKKVKREYLPKSKYK